MKMRKKHYSLIFSLAGHAIALAFIASKWTHSKQEINLGLAQSAVPSYIYQINTSMQKKSIHKTNVSPHGVIVAQQNKTASSLEQKKEQTALPNNPKEMGNGKPIPELVALLHAAIQKQQRYPDSALQMEREGKATLTFILFPNGMIKNLKIVASSGTTVLDEAALAAVNEATPFQGVEKYIPKPEEYQITVGFELA